MWVKYRQRHRFRQDVMGAGKVVGRLDLRWVLKVEIAETGCGEVGKACKEDSKVLA